MNMQGLLEIADMNTLVKIAQTQASYAKAEADAASAAIKMALTFVNFAASREKGNSSPQTAAEKEAYLFKFKPVNLENPNPMYNIAVTSSLIGSCILKINSLKDFTELTRITMGMSQFGKDYEESLIAYLEEANRINIKAQLKLRMETAAWGNMNARYDINSPEFTASDNDEIKLGLFLIAMQKAKSLNKHMYVYVDSFQAECKKVKEFYDNFSQRCQVKITQKYPSSKEDYYLMFDLSNFQFEESMKNLKSFKIWKESRWMRLIRERQRSIRQ